MIYVIGCTQKRAKEFCREVLWIGLSAVPDVKVFPVADTEIRLRGVQFHPGDEVYMVGMDVGPSTLWEHVINCVDMCAMGHAVRTTFTLMEYARRYEILNRLDMEIDAEMREIEALRLKIMEAQRES